MSKLQKSYETRLETANIEGIGAILDAKLEATSQERTVDYISFAVENLEATVARIKQAEAELKIIKKEAESQIETIKIGTAKWMEECGVDSLIGDRISSIKTREPSSTINIKITDEESLINQGYFKTAVDKTKVKNDLQEGIEVEGAEIEVIMNETTLSIYKKRSKNETPA